MMEQATAGLQRSCCARKDSTENNRLGASPGHNTRLLDTNKVLELYTNNAGSITNSIVRDSSNCSRSTNSGIKHC
jgi:hypothetical protein